MTVDSIIVRGRAGLEERAGKPARVATRLVFLVAGLAVSTWAPMVPQAKARAGLDDRTLGLLLLCLGLGSIVAMPLAGALVTRVGCRRVIVPAATLVCLALPLLAVLGDFLELALALFAFGLGLGAVDCAMNVQAILVERAAGRPLMSGFHGLYSLGGILGAGCVSALLSLGASPLVASLCMVAVLGVMLALAWPNLWRDGSTGPAPAFAIPRGPVLLIGALCFVVFLAEGAILDWGAVFLSSERGVDPAMAGLGYAAFSLTMTLCRLTGDAIVARLGRTRVVVLGAVCAATGLALATLLASAPMALLGFALVGIGCANIVPVLFTATGRQSAMPEGAAVAAVTTIGYAGVLVGPAGIGLFAHATSLTVALLVVAAMLVAVAACGHRVRT